MIHWTATSDPRAQNPEFLPGVGRAPFLKMGLAAHAPPFLSDVERQHFTTLRMPKRQRDWLVGRWTAKRLIQSYVEQNLGFTASLHSISIHNAADGAPFVRVATAEHRAVESLGLTISHSAGHGFCAISSAPIIAVGADIEFIERRSPHFVADYFTDSEEDQLPQSGNARDAAVTTIWSAKEAVLKALRLGLSVDTRRVSCHLHGRGDAGWSPFSATCDSLLGNLGWLGQGQQSLKLSGWWQRRGPFVLTVAALGLTFADRPKYLTKR